jgi:hypothetical protein
VWPRRCRTRTRRRDPGGSGLRLMNNTQTQPDFSDPYKLRAGRPHAVAEGREKSWNQTASDFTAPRNALAATTQSAPCAPGATWHCDAPATHPERRKPSGELDHKDSDRMNTAGLAGVIVEWASGSSAPTTSTQRRTQPQTPHTSKPQRRPPTMNHPRRTPAAAHHPAQPARGVEGDRRPRHPHRHAVAAGCVKNRF